MADEHEMSAPAEFLMSNTADFHPPEWACHPTELSQEARLEAYKKDKQCATHVISTQKVTIFGRDPTSCDHVLGNPTVSRKHAAIIHDSAGGIYIVDLMSRHGTYVARTKVPPHDPHLLHEGDVVRFGHSIRVYVLHGASPDSTSKAVKKPWVKLKAPKVTFGSVLPKKVAKAKPSSAVAKIVNDICYKRMKEERMEKFISNVTALEMEGRQQAADFLIEKVEARYELYAQSVHKNAVEAVLNLLKHNMLVDELEPNMSVLTHISQQRTDSIYRANARKILQVMAAVRVDPDHVESPQENYLPSADTQAGDESNYVPPTTNHKGGLRHNLSKDYGVSEPSSETYQPPAAQPNGHTDGGYIPPGSQATPTGSSFGFMKQNSDTKDDTNEKTNGSAFGFMSDPEPLNQAPVTEFLATAPIMERSEVEGLWESTADTEDWTTSTEHTVDMNELAYALEQAKIACAVSERVGGHHRSLFYAQQAGTDTMYLAEVMVFPGVMEVSATFKWIVHSLLYENGHERFIKLFQDTVLHHLSTAPETYDQVDADYYHQSTEAEQEMRNDGPSHSEAETVESATGAYSESGYVEEPDEMPVLDYLTPEPSIEAAQFEQLWISSTAIGTIAYEMESTPAQEEIVEHFQASALNCVASGAVESVLKFFFYGEMLELKCLFSLELEMDSARGSVDATVKRYSFQERETSQSQEIDAAFVQYCERVVEGLQST